VREAIAAGILGFYFLPGEDNPANILGKQCRYTQGKIKILIRRRDTVNMADK
jgi:hypothetical protein